MGNDGSCQNAPERDVDGGEVMEGTYGGSKFPSMRGGRREMKTSDVGGGRSENADC